MISADTIDSVFDQVANGAPDAIAVIDPAGSQLSYAELRDRSDSLALTLREVAGEDPEPRFGVYLDRSAEMIIAMLGILKAAGGYVPLPPDYPENRLLDFLEAADCAAVVASTSTAARAAQFDLPVVTVSVTDEQGPLPASAATRPHHHAESLAYVIFTSGSTGRPKGVAVTHANALSLVAGQQYVPFDSAQTFLQLAPMGFDASAFEIWGALLSGARLVLAAPSYNGFAELPQFLEKYDVSILLLTPSIFRELIRRDLPSFAGVKRLIVGAEEMPVGAAREYAAFAEEHGGSLANVYGPTETTTLVASYDVSSVPPDAVRIPIGRPIAGCTLQLLDELRQPVRSGQVGEIYVSGPSVTRGYLGAPGLTARRFVPDPNSAVPGSRMYATGDRGRRLPSGDLEFLGRVDGQVKVRGQRIEPAEVERQLESHPEVEAAAVVVQESAGGTDQLVAFCVPRTAETPSASVLRALVASALPAYMVPSQITLIPALPMTRSGKVDRQKLGDWVVAGPKTPEPDGALAEQSSATADVPTSAQQIMVDLWSELLGQRPELDDDFFALGGDSLLAIRIVAESEDRGVPVDLLTLFETPTIRALVCGESVDQAARQLDNNAQPDKVPANRSYPATQLQLGLLFESESAEGSAMYHDVIVREVRGRFDRPAFDAALQTVTDRHDVLRTAFDLACDPEPLQIVSATLLPPVVERDRSASGEALQSRLAADAREAGGTFDTTRPPLLRIIVSHIAADHWQLAYGFHHAIMDGWSETVFAHELLSAYDALLQNHAVRLPALTTTFEQFVQLEREQLTDPAARSFWQHRTAGVEPLILAASEQTHAPVATKAVREIDEASTARLFGISRDLAIPVKSLGLAAHLVLLSELADRTDVVTGMVVNGRPETTDTENLIGLFLNIVPLSVEIGGTWDSLAREVFEHERAILPYRRLPYQAIRTIRGESLYDTCFNFVSFRLRSRLDELERLTVSAPVVQDLTSLGLLVELSTDGVSCVVQASGHEPAWSQEQLAAIVRRYAQLLTELSAGQPISR